MIELIKWTLLISVLVINTVYQMDIMHDRSQPFVSKLIGYVIAVVSLTAALCLVIVKIIPIIIQIATI